jgi:hypothetical protein
MAKNGANMANRNPSPDTGSRPATSWATSTVNGFMTAVP